MFFEPFQGCGGQIRVVKYMSLGGVGRVELIEGFFGLKNYPLMCEGRSSSYGQ